jgi:hypothetical protein
VSVESSIYTALKNLVSNRVYRDVAPQTVTTLPRITFQQVGGQAINFFEGSTPDKKNARVQINVWHSRRDDAMSLMRDVEDTLRAATGLQTTVLGAAVSTIELDAIGPGQHLYGAMQDFSFWYAD